MTETSQLDVVKAGLTENSGKYHNLLPPTENTNGLKTEGVKLATKIIFSLYSESVSKKSKTNAAVREEEENVSEEMRLEKLAQYKAASKL